MRRYRLIISLLVLLLPIAFLVGVLSGKSDVLDNPRYYRLRVMDAINAQLDCYCGADMYCRDVYVDC